MKRRASSRGLRGRRVTNYPPDCGTCPRKECRDHGQPHNLRGVAEEDCAMSVAWVREYLPKVLPASWTVTQAGVDGCFYSKSLPPLWVCLSGATELDGKRWLHLSLSHRKRLPTWEEIVEVKELFLGADAKAIQVFAPRKEWVNICKNCLHLWVCVDGDQLPDFTRGKGSI